MGNAQQGELWKLHLYLPPWYNINMALDINYIAGIFDGEGSIGIHKRTVKDASLGYLYYPKIRLGMTGEGVKVVELLKEQFGGYTEWRHYTKDQKDLLTWTLTSKLGISSFLTQVIPHLIVKRAQAQKTLEFLGDQFASVNSWGGRAMPPEEMSRRERLCLEVKLLNKKCKTGSTVAETKWFGSLKGDAIVRPTAII